MVARYPVISGLQCMARPPNEIGHCTANAPVSLVNYSVFVVLSLNPERPRPTRVIGSR